MGRLKEKENNRRLTKAEQQRKMQFEETIAQLKAEGYTPHDLTIGMVYANFMALLLGLPPVVLLGLCFFIKNPAGHMPGQPTASHFSVLAIYLVAFAILTFIHELIHGFFWALFAKKHWKAISFGFMVQYLTPYCCCREALTKKGYLIGAIMPTVLLGVLPALIAIGTGSFLLFSLGALMILAGGGDLTIVLKLLCFRSQSGDTLYLDHPYQGGFVILTR